MTNNVLFLHQRNAVKHVMNAYVHKCLLYLYAVGIAIKESGTVGDTASRRLMKGVDDLGELVVNILEM